MFESECDTCKFRGVELCTLEKVTFTSSGKCKQRKPEAK